MAQEVPSGSGTPRPAAKRKRMGPQECLEYSNTPSGAAALTNPSSVPRSKPEEHQNLAPFQRGKTRGSCFIPSNQPGYNDGHGAKHARQYVSPSKSQLKSSGSGSSQQVYDHSGYACIGSPIKKQFNKSRGHHRTSSYPQTKNSQLAKRNNSSIPQMRNNWKQRTASISPEKGKFTAAGSSSPGQGQFSRKSQAREEHTVVPGNKSFPQSNQSTTKNHVSNGRNSKTSSSSKSFGSSFTRASSGTHLHNFSYPKLTPVKTPPSKSPRKQFEQIDYPKMVQHNTTGGKAKHPAKRDLNHAWDRGAPSANRRDHQTETSTNSRCEVPHSKGKKRLHTGIPPSDHNGTKFKCHSWMTAGNVTPVKQEPMSSQESSKSCDLAVSSQPDSLVSSQPDSIAESLEAFENDSIEDIMEDYDLTEDGSFVSSQPSRSSQEGIDMTQERDSSVAESLDAFENDSIEDIMEDYDLTEDGSFVSSQPSRSSQEGIGKNQERDSSVAESLDAFENDSIEDIMEDYDLTEDGSFVSSQPSRSSQGEIDKNQERDSSVAESLEAFENDSIEDLLEDYDLKEDGSFVSSQPSQSSQQGLSEKVNKKRPEDDETGSTSSDGSVSLFLRYLKSDEDSNSSSAVNDSGTDKERSQPSRTNDIARQESVRTRGSHQPPKPPSKPNLPESSEINYEDMIDDEEFPEELLEQLESGQVPLKNRTFGLVGNDGEVMEEDDPFVPLPVEVMENILCRIPILDLLHSCVRVCHRWRDIITDSSFVPWKKTYAQCKSGNKQWVSPLVESSQESCLLDLIRYLPTIKRLPVVSTTSDLEQHPKYSFAKDMIAENLPDLVHDGTPHPWSVVAALVILAETITDVKDIMTCLIHPNASNSTITITEVLYCVATLLLSLQRKHNLNRSHKVYLDAKVLPASDQPTLAAFANQPATPLKLYDPKQPRAEAITTAIVKELVIGCSMPLSIVEDRHFRAFMKVLEPCYPVVARSTITSKLLPGLEQDLKDRIKETLRDVNALSMTVDIWSDRRMRSFLGVTAHVVDEKDMKLKSFTLCCQRFQGKHTGCNIANAFEELLDEFGVRKKVSYILTDNAANMKNAFQVHFPSQQEEVPASEEDEGPILSMDDVAELDQEDMEEIEATLFSSCGQRLSCFAHTLQLTVADGLKETGRQLSSAIAKSSKLSSVLHTSTVFQERFANAFSERASIPAANSTRWNSSFRQFKSVLSYNHTTLTEICTPQWDNLVFSAREWSQLGELVEVLGPFMEATDLTQGEKPVTISLVVPTVLSLYSQLVKMEVRGSNSSCKAMVHALKVSLKKRFRGIFANVGLHYRVFYALFLYENDVTHSPAVLTDKKPRVTQRASIPLSFEQKRIVSHKLEKMDEVVKVVAFAGTGKTTTLIKFAEANIYLRMLYVAFNKSVQVEARTRFPGNTMCRTSHSLAYKIYRPKYERKLAYGNLRPYEISQLLPERPKSQKSSLQYVLYARLVGDTLKAYMASDDDIITTKHVPTFYTTPAAGQTLLLHQDRMWLLRDAECIWARMIDEKDMKAKITHDGYFKLYQLSKPIIEDVQCLLIDEAQDLTPAQQDVLLRQPVPKILVGDPNQQIYSFRGAKNAMNTIEADSVYHLTQSFRFGTEIAYMANCILDVFKNMTEQTVIGKDEEGTICGEHIGQLAIICRGNTTIFKEAVRLVTTTPEDTRLKLGFTAPFNYSNLLDLHRMRHSAKLNLNLINNPFYKKMGSFVALDAYANHAEDNELLGLISIVKMFGYLIPEHVKKIKAKTVQKLEYATIVLTTAHKAKGLEFDTVQLTEDFQMFGPTIMQANGEILITENIRLPEDEKNLIYVACTRAKKSLLLNVGLKTCLQKASDQLKFPVSTKVFLDGAATLEGRRCLDCGQPITSQHRITMLKVWAVKMAHSRNPPQQNNPTNNGGYICSLCAHHHMRGFEKIFLGNRNAPNTANIALPGE